MKRTKVYITFAGLSLFTVILSLCILKNEKEGISKKVSSFRSSCVSLDRILFAIFSKAENGQRREQFRSLNLPRGVDMRFILEPSTVDLSKEISKYEDIVVLPIDDNADAEKSFSYFQYAWTHFKCYRYYFKAVDSTAINFVRLSKYVQVLGSDQALYVGRLGSDQWSYTTPVRSAAVDINGIRIYDVDLIAIAKRLKTFWRSLGGWFRGHSGTDFNIDRKDEYFLGDCYGINWEALAALIRLHPTEMQGEEGESFSSWMRQIQASFHDVGTRFHHLVPPPGSEQARRCLWDWYCAETSNRSIAVFGCSNSSALRLELARLEDDGRASVSWVGIRVIGRLGNQLFLLASGHGIARARGAKMCVADWKRFEGDEAVEMVGERVPTCPDNVSYVSATEGLFWQRFHPHLMVGEENIVPEDFLQSYR